MSRHKYPEHRWLLEEWISAGLPMLLTDFSISIHSALPRKHIAILIGQDLSSRPLFLWQKWVGNRLPWNTKGLPQRSPWKAPCHYFTSFMCWRHPRTRSGGGTRSTCWIRSTPPNISLLLLRGFCMSFIFLGSCAPDCISAWTMEDKRRPDWIHYGSFSADRQALTAKGHTGAHTWTHTDTRTVWLHFSLWICLVVVCRWQLYPHYSV